MIITETIKRECCDTTKDLKVYRGALPKNMTINHKILFCGYCGQIWYETKNPGDMDYGYQKLITFTEH